MRSCFLVTLSLLVTVVVSQSCTAAIFDEYSSGWSSTETLTTTPLCDPSCTYPDDAMTKCICVDDPVPAGEGQPGTAEGGPCESLDVGRSYDYPQHACYGFSRATWALTDNVLTSPVAGLTTNAQTLIGQTNMSPPGIFDTGLSSTGFYAIKMSTDNGDDDWMGFVLVSLTAHDSR